MARSLGIAETQASKLAAAYKQFAIAHQDELRQSGERDSSSSESSSDSSSIDWGSSDSESEDDDNTTNNNEQRRTTNEVDLEKKVADKRKLKLLRKKSGRKVKTEVKLCSKKNAFKN